MAWRPVARRGGGASTVAISKDLGVRRLEALEDHGTDRDQHDARERECAESGEVGQHAGR